LSKASRVPAATQPASPPLNIQIGGKWLELLKELAPDIKRVLVVFVQANYTSRGLLRSIEEAAATLGVTVVPSPVQNAGDIERAMEGFARDGGGGLLAPPHTIIANSASLLLDLARTHRLPAVYPFRQFARLGGLAAYGAVETDAYQRAAGYIDRILKGARPGDLPVQNPSKFELAVNLKTAHAIGRTLPPSFVIRADEVIE
jgi:ABC-type uncharacterized transport system substrate-binding protein